MAQTQGITAVRQWQLHLVFAGLLALAYHYRYERLYMDAAYYLIHPLDSGVPRMDHQRFVLALAEFPAMLVQWCGGGAEAVISAYSLGHVLWAWLAAWACMRLQRNELAVAVLLTQLVGRSFIHFTPMLEVCYGCTTGIVLLAWWQRYPVPRGAGLVVWAILSLLTITSHPLNWFTYATIALVVWLESGMSRRCAGLAFAPILFVIWLKYAFLSPYENERLRSGILIARLYDLPHMARVAKLLLIHYPDALLLALAGTVILLRQQRGMLVLHLLLLGGCTFALVNMNMDASEAGWYLEVLYFPAAFAAVLIGSLALPYLHGRAARWALFGLFAIVAGRGIRIHQLGTWHVARTEKIQELLEDCRRTGGGKCVFASDHARPTLAPGRPGTWEWSLPMEAMLLSRIDDAAPISLITTSDLAHDPTYAALPDSMILFRRQEPRSIRSLKADWFQVQPGPYRWLGPMASAQPSPTPPAPRSSGM